MLENYEIRARARAILQGNWNTCAIILLVYWVVNMGISLHSPIFNPAVFWSAIDHVFLGCLAVACTAR